MLAELPIELLVKVFNDLDAFTLTSCKFVIHISPLHGSQSDTDTALKGQQIHQQRHQVIVTASV